MKSGTVCGPSFEVPVSIQKPMQCSALFGIPFEARRQRRPKDPGHGFNGHIINLRRRIVGSNHTVPHGHGFRSSKQWVHALVLQQPPGAAIVCSSLARHLALIFCLRCWLFVAVLDFPSGCVGGASLSLAALVFPPGGRLRGQTGALRGNAVCRRSIRNIFGSRDCGGGRPARSTALCSRATLTLAFPRRRVRGPAPRAAT